MSSTADIDIVIPLYPGVTQLDFTGPHQVFSRLPGAQLTVACEGGAPIEAEGLVFAELHDLAAVTDCDVLCVPGGFGCTDAMTSAGYMAAIERLAATADYVVSVCTGSLILAAAGLLHGRRAACHWAWRDMLGAFGAIADDARVVRDGRFWTGGGVTAGIDVALSLAAEIAGVAAAQTIQLGLEYAPQPPFDSGRPESAPPAVVDAYRAQLGERLTQRREALRVIAAQRGR